eukprot:11170954-Lingulodinium_polyedra.AAC.1
MVAHHGSSRSLWPPGHTYRTGVRRGCVGVGLRRVLLETAGRLAALRRLYVHSLVHEPRHGCARNCA